MGRLPGCPAARQLTGHPAQVHGHHDQALNPALCVRNALRNRQHMLASEPAHLSCADHRLVLHQSPRHEGAVGDVEGLGAPDKVAPGIPVGQGQKDIGHLRILGHQGRQPALTLGVVDQRAQVDRLAQQAEQALGVFKPQPLPIGHGR